MDWQDLRYCGSLPRHFTLQVDNDFVGRRVTDAFEVVVHRGELVHLLGEKEGRILVNAGQ